MDFEFLCSCGKSHAIQPSQAGTSLACSCGKEHVLPTLSALRRSAGLPAFEVSTADAVWTALRSGNVELDDSCIECSVSTNDVHVVWAICERAYRHIGGGNQLTIGFIPVAETDVRDEDRGRDVVVPLLMRLCKPCAKRFVVGRLGNALWLMHWLLLAGGLGVVLLAILRPVARIDIPISIAPSLLAAAAAIYLIEWWLARRNQAELKSIACKIPKYNQLLSEYPHAELSLGKAETS